MTGEVIILMIKLLLADDSEKFLDFIKEILNVEKEFEVIGEARNGEEAILKAKELKPDVVLMDVRMPGMNGLEASREIKQIIPVVKTIILTIYDIDEYRNAAATSGAFGFILKKSMRKELIQTIREAFESRDV